MGINAVHEFFIRHRWISDPEQLIINDEVSDATGLTEKSRSTISLSNQTILLCDLLYVMLKNLNVAIMLVLGFVWPSRIFQGVQFSLYSIIGYVVGHSIFGVVVVVTCKQHCTGSAQPSSHFHCHVPFHSEVAIWFEFHRGVRKGSEDRATSSVY
jgi:hypothetical protein